MSQSITLNGNSIQSPNIISAHLVHENVQIDEGKVKIPHRHGEKLVSYTYSTKAITIDGSILNTTASGTDLTVDLLKSYMGLQAVPLVFDYAGGSQNRQYTVNVLNVAFPRDYFHLTYVPFSMSLEACNPPFAYDTASTNQYLTTTSGTLSASLTMGGTAPAAPIITLTALGTLSGLAFNNTTTNTQINITVTTASGNVISIDTNNYTVNLNGNPYTTYSGVFPTFLNGSNNFTVTPTGTAKYTVSVDATLRYL